MKSYQEYQNENENVNTQDVEFENFYTKLSQRWQHLTPIAKQRLNQILDDANVVAGGVSDY